MKKLILTSSLFYLTSYILFAQGTWTTKANLGTSSDARLGGAGFELSGYGYIGTGYNGTAKNDFWKYDPTADTWTQKANFGGTARYNATGFSVNGYGFIGLGFASPNDVQDFWKYDPTANTWTQVANFGGGTRELAAAFVIGSYAYVGTGVSGSTVKNDLYQYDPVGNTWTAKANYGGTACCGAVGFAVGGKGYIALGRNSNSSTYYKTIYEYSTSGNSWTAKTNFTGASRAGSVAFTLSTFGYVGLGESANNATLYNDFYKFDPTANSWSAIATFPSFARSYGNGFTIGTYGYAGMGYNSGGQMNTWYKYDVCGITTTVTPTAPLCNGGSNGSISVTVGTATAPFTYLWSNSGTTQNQTGLAAGAYTVNITDAVGCTKTSTVTVTQPTAMSATIPTVTNAPCNGTFGSACANVTGGTPPYTYAWAPMGGNAQCASNLAPGSYTLVVTDSHGCTAPATVTITQPTPLTSTITATNSTKACVCNGTASVTPSGGTPGYTYIWSNGKNSSTITGLCAGNYSVTIVDANGCTITAADTIGIPALTLSMTATPATCPSCANGDATVNVNGGTGPFTYSWTTTPMQTTQTATGLTPAYYHVCVTDADTCSICDSVYVGFAVGVQEISEENISISPNPSRDGKFQVSSLKSQVSSIEVYNLVGEKIYEVNPINQLTGYSINLSAGNGVYFIKIKFADAVLTRKIIVSR